MLNRAGLLQLANDYLSKETDDYFKADLQKVIDSEDWDELNDRFYTALEFGTAGLRGVIGGGLNRMNPYNIAIASQGLADYLNSNLPGEKSAVIGYDSRLFSETFAQSAALVLAANGIKVYLFTSLRPTPVVSYAIRRLGCATGVMVTASHNPAPYNGFKVYWSNGCQVVPPHDRGIIQAVRSVQTVRRLSKEEAVAAGLLCFIDKEIDDAMVEMTKANALRPDMIARQAKQTKIVYTPLNGTGRVLVERILTEMGMQVITVPEQAEPDGHFPTCPFPNPEIADAMQLALRLGAFERADLVIGTDPDADRLGIAVPTDSDKQHWQLITGNQLGAMLTYYLLDSRKEQGTLPPKPVVVKTIVTTELTRRIADSFGAVCDEVLTGFKWIGTQMDRYEAEGGDFIIGYEESYGFLISKEIRDKDAVGAAAMVAELALYCASRQMTVLDYLNSLYRQFGYFKEIQISKTFEGEAGLQAMEALMDSVRNHPPQTLADETVDQYLDYQQSTALPKSNVLQFKTREQTVLTVRPSGTEPKIKFYLSCCSPKGTDLEAAKQQVDHKVRLFRDFIEKVLCR